MRRNRHGSRDKQNVFTRPLTAEALDVIFCVAILLSGSSGFINILGGSRFPRYKIALLAFGLVWSVVIVLDRRLHRTKSRVDEDNEHGP
jgi:hypothetical protein